MNTAILRGTRSRFRIAQLLTLLREWHSTHTERRTLGRLLDHELKDIGLTRLEANAEARRWFWDTEPRDFTSLR